MTKEEQALKDFLGNLGGNNDEPDINLGTEEGDETVVTTEDDPNAEPVIEEKLPFHKDPKVQRYIERQLEKKMQGKQPIREEQSSPEAKGDSSLIDAFTTVIGNDTPEKIFALKQLERTITSMEERTRKAEEASEVVSQMRQSQAEEQQSIQYLEDSIERIEDNYGVDLTSNTALARKTRNEFLDFLGRVSPKDEYGNIKDYADPEESYEIFKSLKKPEPKVQAKEIVARGMGRSSADATNTPTKRITFDNVREMMGLDN